ncbi:MAG: fumarylacetoacetase [Acetobacteraceae bacterium]
MSALDETHDPNRRSWVASANLPATDFPIQNLPFGVFSIDGAPPTGGVAIGGRVVDLARCVALGLFEDEALLAARAATGPTLNPLLALGRGPARALRRRLSALLNAEASERTSLAEAQILHDMARCRLHLPVAIGDYTDFYAGIYHAKAIGGLMQPDNPLPENYKWVPIAYHGRASSVRVSGGRIARPSGQLRRSPNTDPVYAPCERLDLELELGVFVGGNNPLGRPTPIGAAAERIFGICLLNDWSARDVQAWEMVPLGPFLAKNFSTTISPWIVTYDALLPFRHPAMVREPGDPRPLPYLWDGEDQASGAFDIDLDVAMSTAHMRANGRAAEVVIRSNGRHLYWTPAQMIAHHTSGGCNLSAGDLLGTGTISGPDPSQLSSFMELTKAGAQPFTLKNGEARSFLQDGDEIILTGKCRRDSFVPIGFGECRGTIIPDSLAD